MTDQVAAGRTSSVEDRAPAPSGVGPAVSHAGASAAVHASPLRQAAYAAVLVALCFVQSPGMMVADTKFDLLTHPWRFVTQGLRLWDPNAAFGQVPDQSYGYAWPMGPFFSLGSAIDLPPWMVQRLWWATLLCLAFFGVLRLCKELGLGSELTRVVAAFVFVLTPRITTLVGVASVEVWPMALAPWVLLPLVRGSRTGQVRRAAAASALVVVCCGGVNAVAVAAVLPLGLVWILTRAPGPRRGRLLGWWVLFVVLGTVWWSGPLLMVGRYSPHFLDYIENATVTTLPTDLTRTLLGISDWVAYFGADFSAGHALITTPYLVLDAAAVAALGLLGICLRDNPHRRFLVYGVLLGLLLVGFGYDRQVAGLFAHDRLHALDQALAPLRNLHKFDVVLRLPLVLGLAHGLTVLPRALRGPGSVLARRVTLTAVALAVLGLVTPWARSTVAAGGGAQAVPAYWDRAATYLARHDDGSVSLELPASAFGVYAWGNAHDDVLQGLARSPWAVRSVVPLAQPGNVVFLDAVTRVVESGRASPVLARYLADNGVGRLVVRNDLDRFATGAPDPAYVRSVLSATPGLSLVASFGPLTGSLPYTRADDADRTRIVASDGISTPLRAIEVYRVRPPARATLSSPGQVLLGDPSSGVDAGLASLPPPPALLAADRSPRDGSLTGQVVTDDLKRREMSFPAVRWNQSSTMTAGERYRLPGKEHALRVVGDARRWQTTEVWAGGIAGVTASSSQAYADATPPLAVGSDPGAVFDHDRSTAWHSASRLDPDGQWWQVRFSAPRQVKQVAVRLSRDSAAVGRLRISGGGQARSFAAPRPGAAATYEVGLPETHTLRITAVATEPHPLGSVGFSEVSVDRLQPLRYLRLPRPVGGAPVDVISLSRDPDRLPCAQVGPAFTCSPILSSPGEDGDTLARLFTVPDRERFSFTGTASLRRHSGAWRQLLHGTGVSVTASPRQQADPAMAVGAMVDGDPSTTWISTRPRPVVDVGLPRAVRLHTLQMTLNPAAAASLPQRVEVDAGRHRAVVDLDQQGRAVLPGWRVRRLHLRIDSTRPAFSLDGTSYTKLDPGVTELKIDGRSLTANAFHTIDLPCGKGPRLLLGRTVYDTWLVGNARDLVRGASVPLHLCAPGAVTLSGSTRLVATPTRTVRVDSITWRRPGTSLSATTPLAVHRDAGGMPVSITVPARSTVRLLTLPQNVNAGWQASLGATRLIPQRVDGWKQGWLLPPGRGGTVQLHFTPAAPFAWLLGLGALLVLVVVVAATPLRVLRRGRDLPPLGTARAGWFDLLPVVVVTALLTGWVGLALLAGCLWVARRWDDLRAVGGWAAPAAGVLLLAAAALTWRPLLDQSWAMYWAQGFAMLAVACLSASLFRTRRTPRRRPLRPEAPAPGAGADPGS